MGFPTSESRYRIVQPLLDAGLRKEEVERLLVRLTFDATLGGGTLGDLGDLVEGRPPEVRAAWTRSLVRLLADDPDAEIS
jgi:hypothetical protein